MARAVAALLILAAVLVFGPSSGMAAGFQLGKELASEAEAYASQLGKRGKPDAVEAKELFVRAKAMAGQEKWPEAMDLFEQAVTANPESVDAWLGLAAAWLPLPGGETRGGQAAYRAYLVTGGDEAKTKPRAQSLVLLATALERQERPRTAIKALRASLALAPDANVRKELDRLMELHGFQAIGITTETSSDRPELCVRFRSRLSSSRAVRYGDYVRVEPAVKGDVVPRDDRLCLSGVEYGKGYDVTVLAGLPDQEGETLEADKTLHEDIGDRAPSVAFQGGAYVLPRVGSSGIPVVSINLDKVRLKILRINDRNLMLVLNEGRLLQALYRWDLERMEDEIGHLVWEGVMDVEREHNARVTTAFPVDEVLKTPAPGVYILIAEPADSNLAPPSWESRATQWLVVSDLGLTSFSGDDGLHVFVRSLATGKPVQAVTVRLFGYDNGLLGEAPVDASGLATLDAGLLRGVGGQRPRAVYAVTDGGDFAFLDITEPAFDLSDRGVGGRTMANAMDVFLYADRGVYRRGETANVVALLRDPKAKAVPGMPLHLRLRRPDTVEALTLSVTGDAPGAYHVALPFVEDSQTGKWTLETRVEPDGPILGTLGLLVEDIVPPRIETRLTTEARIVAPGEPVSVNVAADYFYGAPAAGLAAEAEVTVLEDTEAHAELAGFHFGLEGETVEPQRTPITVSGTDRQGRLSFEIALETIPDVSRPLKAVIRAGVFEPGGRPATASLTLPVRQRDSAIGIKPLFDKEVSEGSEATFEVIAVDGAGARAAASLSYAFYREEWDYRWYLRNGAWDYEINVLDVPLDSGTLVAAAAGANSLKQKVEWGRYRLEVFDPATGAATSVRFRAGWFVAPTAAATPDTLEVVTDRATYRPGDSVQVRVKAPFAGEVLLVVANNGILESHSVALPAEGATVTLPFAESWGVGAYILATAFRPDGPDRGPGRAIGLAWVGVDPKPRTLAVTIDAPDDIRPRGPVDVALAVDGVTADQPAYVTLAAVDEGVLQLTDFRTPDPAGHFYGKRRLGVLVRDLWGRLIDGKTKRRGAIRAGGGDPRLGGRGAPPVDARIVSLFSGIVALDKSGHATVRLQVPEFNGRLRLMAVAFDGSRVGAAEDAMLVRDPVVAQLSLPRFLAPGDTSRLTLALRNLTGAAGDYTASLAVDGAVAVEGEAKAVRVLAQGEEAVAVFSVKALSVGQAKVSLTLAGPDGDLPGLSRVLAVRPAQFRVTRRIARKLEPGKSVSYSAKLLEEFLPGTGEVTLAFNGRPDLDVPGLLRRLDRYPYGCLEQTTSRALPLLYVADVAHLWGGQGATEETRHSVQRAIDGVLRMQSRDGGFSLWTPQGDVEIWLSSYAMEFLTRAKAKGYEVPPHAYLRGLDWLKSVSADLGRNDEERLAANAYALHVLALAGVGDAGPARYLADTQGERIPTALAAAQLGAALAAHGDGERSRTMFARARQLLQARPPLRDYGTLLRDQAALVALASNVERPGIDLPEVLADLADRQGKTDYLSTQEMSWLILAAAEVGRSLSDTVTLKVADKTMPPSREPIYLAPDTETLGQGVRYANAGKAALWHTLALSGIPRAEEPAMEAGFRISREFRTKSGDPVDLTRVRQNDMLVAVVEGEATDGLDHQALIVDLLPAGLEVENARLANGQTAKDMGWLPELHATLHEEFRDDRYVAAMDLAPTTRVFALAYLVRAVTPGSYALPAIHVEDMYKANDRARGEMGHMTILPAE